MNSAGAIIQSGCDRHVWSEVSSAAMFVEQSPTSTTSRSFHMQTHIWSRAQKICVLLTECVRRKMLTCTTTHLYQSPASILVQDMTSGSGMFHDAASSRMLQRFWERQAVATANSSSLSGRGLPQRNSNDSGPNNKSQQAAATSRWECGGITFAIMCLDEGAHHYMFTL